MKARDAKSLKLAIVHHGRQCEEYLQLAHFAATEPSLSGGMADALRKMAAISSADAFACARRLHPRSFAA